MLKQMFALIAIAAASTAASSATNSADVKYADVKSFKDWAVACDNGLACEATTYFAEDFGDDQIQLTMSRAAGRDGEIKISLYGFKSASDRYQLFIDGRLIDTGAITSEQKEITRWSEPVDKIIEIGGADAVKVARAMVAGRKLTLADGGGSDIGKVSLAGSAASLRYMDAAQGRVGRTNALAAKGRKKAGGLSPTLPVIDATKIVPNQILPDAASLVSLSEISPCAAERDGLVSEDTAFSLGNDASGAPRALVLLFCGTGAYNPSYGIYVGTRAQDGKWDFQPATFDHKQAFTQTGKIPLMGYAEWDAASQTLNGYYKNRGIGDCGGSEQYVWDGQRFRLTAARDLDVCRGAMDWLTVWRADVKLRG